MTGAVSGFFVAKQRERVLRRGGAKLAKQHAFRHNNRRILRQIGPESGIAFWLEYNPAAVASNGLTGQRAHSTELTHGSGDHADGMVSLVYPVLGRFCSL